MIRYFALALATGLALSGCVSSLQPLCTSGLTHDPELAGVWIPECPVPEWQEQSPIYTIRRSILTPHDYEVTLQEKDHEGTRYEANLIVLGSSRFIDLRASAPGTTFDTVRVHHIVRYEVDGDLLRIYSCDPNALKRVLKERGLSLSFVEADGRILLTAPTNELQEFARKHGSEVWIVETRARRQPQPAPVD